MHHPAVTATPVPKLPVQIAVAAALARLFADADAVGKAAEVAPEVAANFGDIVDA
ncbi:unnamed protein product [Periconia digitata]|uniref:Uncharacterized protein n=1 Tax=Periconia digitata TaxID=1303443 RepID=A0A9W4URK8_9PLEO|nr:unnamed protein product [Periconia digitata]